MQAVFRRSAPFAGSAAHRSHEHINLKEEASDVSKFSEEEMRSDSLERAGLEMQLWRQKVLLITD